MAKHAIEMYVPINLPPISAKEATMRIMDLIAQGAPPYDNLSFTVNLRDLNVPMDAEVRVQVQAEIRERPHRWECGIAVRASKEKQFFPKFAGTLTITPSSNQSELWMQGEYEPPLGALGAGLNATVMRGAAERSLHRFLEWLGQAIYANGMETERQHIRDIRASGYQ